jgi:Protein of unknown function (DUF3467)
MSEPTPPENPKDPSFSQEVQHSHISARVPEKVARGVFSTGVFTLQGSQEFALDFVQRIVKPFQVVARVILPPPVIPRLVAALQDNLKNYTATFGAPVPLQAPPPPAQPPSVAEIYDEMKLADDVAAGVFANGAMITHTQVEFCLDFIVNLFPRSVVSCRVYLAAPHVPGLIQSLNRSYQQFQQRSAGPNKPV